MKGAGASEVGRIRLEGEVAAYVDIRPEDLGRINHAALRDLRLTRATEVPAETSRQESSSRSQGRRERPSEGERKRVVYR
jgi:ATP-dependent RNA helicase DeaD